MLDTKPIGAFRRKSWNYVAVGAGHGVQWWQESFFAARMAGYDGMVSLEMEDLTLPMLKGHLSFLRTLRRRWRNRAGNPIWSLSVPDTRRKSTCYLKSTPPWRLRFSPCLS